MQPDFDLIRRILKIGVPGGVDVILVSICHLIYLRIVLSLGDIAAAAHGVAIQVEALGYMPGGAFQISAATMAGQYLGARDLVRARHSVVMAWRWPRRSWWQPACSFIWPPRRWHRSFLADVRRKSLRWPPNYCESSPMPWRRSRW